MQAHESLDWSQNAKSRQVVQEVTPPLFDALVLYEPGPCQNCRLAARCGTRHLACDAFAQFVDGRRAESWQAAPREPTRALYSKILKPHQSVAENPHGSWQHS